MEALSAAFCLMEALSAAFCLMEALSAAFFEKTLYYVVSETSEKILFLTYFPLQCLKSTTYPLYNEIIKGVKRTNTKMTIIQRNTDRIGLRSQGEDFHGSYCKGSLKYPEQNHCFLESVVTKLAWN